MSAEHMKRRAREPSTFVIFLLGAAIFIGGWLILEWPYTFGTGLVLMVLPTTHVLFGTYDRRTR